jgi:hypothetical protein
MNELKIKRLYGLGYCGDTKYKAVTNRNQEHKMFFSVDLAMYSGFSPPLIIRAVQYTLAFASPFHT